MAEDFLLGLTIGERLIIHRRRLSFTQNEMAELLGIHRNSYGDYERDKTKPPSTIEIPSIDTLSDHEKCFLLRRRAGLKQEEVAEKMGITRYWFDQMELGNASCTPLVEYWL